VADPDRLTPLPPEEAIAYFRRKGLAEGFSWMDVWEAEHARAFTVAKAMSREILEDIRAEVDRALAEGRTLAQFREALTPVLQAKGWWGRQEATDPQTGETRPVQLGSPRRLRTIYEVNVRTAHQAGRWERIQRVKASMPYLRYTAVMDGRTRPEHRAWHGTVLPVDDPWWDVHYPPCGWNCRCTVTQMSERTLERRGYAVTERPAAFPARPFTNRRTGEVTTVPGGIDPGWAYNVGKAGPRAQTPRPLPDAPDAGPDGEADAVSGAGDPRRISPLPIDVTAEAAIAAFLTRLDAVEPRVMTDVAGERVAIGPDLFRDADGRTVSWPAARLRSLNLAAEVLADPDEIRESWRAAKESRPMLVHRWLGEFLSTDGPESGRLIVVMVEVGRDGWRVRSTLEPDVDAGAFRSPAVVFRRPD
jgi:SPP1 gp7 family putative phage head morphogenesis protein